jgi:hypothetical protein
MPFSITESCCLFFVWKMSDSKNSWKCWPGPQIQQWRSEAREHELQVRYNHTATISKFLRAYFECHLHHCHVSWCFAFYTLKCLFVSQSMYSHPDSSAYSQSILECVYFAYLLPIFKFLMQWPKGHDVGLGHHMMASSIPRCVHPDAWSVPSISWWMKLNPFRFLMGTSIVPWRTLWARCAYFTVFLVCLT